MNIYVSDELTTLKNQLADKGYNLVSSNNIEHCDAIIINLKKNGIENVNPKNIKKECTLIIDSGAKDVNDIEQILNNKLSTTS